VSGEINEYLAFPVSDTSAWQDRQVTTEQDCSHCKKTLPAASSGLGETCFEGWARELIENAVTEGFIKQKVNSVFFESKPLIVRETLPLPRSRSTLERESGGSDQF
jgi:hypothetical protein